MKRLFYSWMVFQMLIGVWMFISSFVFGFAATDIAASNMISGTIIVMLGAGYISYEIYHEERLQRESLERPSLLEHAKERK